jgi:hypothetical protein
MAKAQTHYVFSFQQQIQKKTKTISVGYSELDNEARMVKVAEAKKYCKTLIKAHPSWGIERVIQNLEKNGFIKSVIRKKTGKQSVKEIIVLVKDLGHSNFKSHGGIVSTEQQHAFLYNLAKTKLNKQQQSLYDQLKANGIDFDNFNIRNKVENLYNDVKGDPKFDVLHDDFYKSETKNEDDDVTEVPESIFEGAKNAAMMDDNENVNDEDNGKDSDDDDEYDDDEYDNDDDNENGKKKKNGLFLI